MAAGTAAAWAGTALAAETFQVVPVNEAAAHLGEAVHLVADLPAQVAREVLPAWAAGAVVVGAVVEGEGVGGEGSRRTFEEKPMKTKSKHSFVSRILLPACAIALSCVLGPVGYTAAQTKAKTATPVKQKRFATSQQAATALIQAAEQYDVPALLEILGPGGAELVITKDTAQDKQRAAMFTAKAQEKTSVTEDPKNPTRAILSVGNEEWPYPVPIVKRSGKWYFDAWAGRKEILDRRIGANELDALAICRGYAEVQKKYALEAHDGVNQYAQRIISTRWRGDSQGLGEGLHEQD